MILGEKPDDEGAGQSSRDRPEDAQQPLQARGRGAGLQAGEGTHSRPHRIIEFEKNGAENRERHRRTAGDGLTDPRAGRIETGDIPLDAFGEFPPVPPHRPQVARRAFYHP